MEDPKDLNPKNQMILEVVKVKKHLILLLVVLECKVHIQLIILDKDNHNKNKKYMLKNGLIILANMDWVIY